MFARHKISIDLIATSEVSVSVSVDEPVQAESPFVQDLGALGEVELQEHQAIVSMVGAEIANDASLLSRVFQTLKRETIGVNMVSL